MTERYYRLVEGYPVELKLPVMVGGRMRIHPTKSEAAMLGAYPLDDNPPPGDAPAGKNYEPSGYEVVDGHITRTYALVDDPAPAIEEYDAAMEEHLRAEREARGYTTREPDAYLTSQVGRWAQDARDWVAHRDEVMAYALAILNAVQGGTMEPPTMADFVAGLPAIVWSYSEE